VIRGETDHYGWVCSAAAHGIELVQVQTGVPCAFGVLTVDNLDQALARSGGDRRDQGYNAALVVVRMSRLVREISTKTP
jgi:6,7-dimethyl-8-ribityllumazine synthase